MKGKPKVVFTQPIHYALPVTQAAVDTFIKSRTVEFKQTSTETHISLSDEVINDEEEDQFMKSGLDAEEEKEYNGLKQEIGDMRKEIDIYIKQVKFLKKKLASFEAANAFYEKHSATFKKDEDHIEKQNNRSKKIVHKQKMLHDLNKELKELKESLSSNSLFQLSEDLKKEKKLLINTKEKVWKNFDKIKRAQQKLQEEKKNLIYGAVTEQSIKIEEIENSIKFQITDGNLMKREIVELENITEENENEIQDLKVDLANAEYKREKRERQFFHLLKKQEKEIEDFNCRPNRIVTKSEDANARRLFVGIFSQKSMSTKIQTAFRRFGEIEFIRLLSTNSKPPKYFAHIQYYSHEDARIAMLSLNRQTVNGQNLNIQWASDQPAEQSEKPLNRKKQKMTPRSSLNLRPITNRQIHPPQSRLKLIQKSGSASNHNGLALSDNSFASSSA